MLVFTKIPTVAIFCLRIFAQRHR